MKRRSLLRLVFFAILVLNCFADDKGEMRMDELILGNDKIGIHFYGHSSLMFEYNGLTIYIDPVTQYADYRDLPQADYILITHEHGDHLDKQAIDSLMKSTTVIISNQACIDRLRKGTALDNSQTLMFDSFSVEAVPAYNTTAGRDKFHPKGRDNGYILTLGESRIYIAGDTEDIPEMKDFKNIAVAFLPVNQPYTMTPDQLLSAVKMISPGILYPYHFGNTDTGAMERLIRANTKTEVRIRQLQ